MCGSVKSAGRGCFALCRHQPARRCGGSRRADGRTLHPADGPRPDFRISAELLPDGSGFPGSFPICPASNARPFKSPGYPALRALTVRTGVVVGVSPFIFAASIDPLARPIDQRPVQIGPPSRQRVRRPAPPSSRPPWLRARQIERRRTVVESTAITHEIEAYIASSVRPRRMPGRRHSPNGQALVFGLRAGFGDRWRDHVHRAIGRIGASAALPVQPRCRRGGPRCA